MSQPLYFYDSTAFGSNSALTTSFVKYNFGLKTKNMLCIAPEYSNTDVIFFSIDGVNIEGRLNPQDSMVNLPQRTLDGIWLKGNSGSQNFRLWAF